MLQPSPRRGLAPAGMRYFPGMASSADFKRQDFKESVCLDLLSGIGSY
jgi:hypothetical protein